MINDYLENMDNPYYKMRTQIYQLANQDVKKLVSNSEGYIRVVEIIKQRKQIFNGVNLQTLQQKLQPYQSINLKLSFLYLLILIYKNPENKKKIFDELHKEIVLLIKEQDSLQFYWFLQELSSDNLFLLENSKFVEKVIRELFFKLENDSMKGTKEYRIVILDTL